MLSKGRTMDELDEKEDPELLWLVTERTTRSLYFNTEQEAKDYHRLHPETEIEPPEVK